LGFQARNRFFVTRSDNWDAFMLQSKPSIHSQMNIDTYFVLAPIAIRAQLNDRGFLTSPITVQDSLIQIFTTFTPNKQNKNG
jgi:hypothetical protein